jgi:hypothetical protein
MPTTGRLYDPGAPTALEAALAQQVASGQSPFAGSLLSAYGLQRQQNVAAVNEAQAQTHLADLANLLAQEKLKGTTSVAGAALSSGRGIGPTLGAANTTLGMGMDPNAVAATGAQADLANNLNMAKTGAEVQNLGSEAGGGWRTRHRCWVVWALGSRPQAHHEASSRVRSVLGRQSRLRRSMPPPGSPRQGRREARARLPRAK